MWVYFQLKSFFEYPSARPSNYINYKNWGEFTGLKDKNGKEIYEGDVLTGDYQIIFDDSAFSANINQCFYHLDEYFLKDKEIIGNIYENPELLDK